eukprot:6457619-Amphidinium_carterae.2
MTGGSNAIFAAVLGSDAFSALKHNVGDRPISLISLAASDLTPRYSCRESAKRAIFSASELGRPPLPVVDAPDRRSNSCMRCSILSTILFCSSLKGRHNTPASRSDFGLPKDSQVKTPTIELTRRCHSRSLLHLALLLEEPGAWACTKTSG